MLTIFPMAGQEDSVASQETILGQYPTLCTDMAEALSDWVCIIDLHLRIVRSNRAVKRFLGISRDEILGKACYEIVGGTCRRTEHCPFPTMLQTRQRASADIRLSDGRWLSVTVDPLTDSNGKILGALHLVRDITAQRAAQAGRESLVHELEQTLSKIKTLKGLIPICACCRRIRDKDGTWYTLEDIVRRNFDADFSHGLCPECAAREMEKLNL